jgi:glycosyltransferase involved in cell wall biosynthesis
MKKWDLLVLSQPSRIRFLWQLLEILKPQIHAKPVEIKIRQFDPAISLGENRNILRRQSTAEYVSFLDDDDLVTNDFVAKILPLLDGVDQVSFNCLIYRNWTKLPMAYHSLKYGNWFQDDNGFYRDISHIASVMRRELAIRVPMEGGIGEDWRWSQEMRKLGIVKTEHHVEEPLYHYIERHQKNDRLDWKDPRRLALIQSLSQDRNESR